MMLWFQIEVNDHAASESHNGSTSITLNVRRRLSYNGNEVAAVQGDIAGRYSGDTPKGQPIIRNSIAVNSPAEESSTSKPVPAPRTSSLVRRPSSAGIKFKKPVLTAYDLEPTGPPDRTYKVSNDKEQRQFFHIFVIISNSKDNI